MTDRRRLLLLIVTLILGLGGLGFYNTLRTDAVDQRTRDEFRRVQQQQDRDMCDMLAALLPSAAPAPTSSYGAEQRAAVQRYQTRRC